MKEIILTKGKIALVDDQDFESLSKWSWSTLNAPRSRTFYAIRGVNKDNKKILIHRQILNLNNPKIIVDHIDGNGLNNQRSNLRLCTRSQNLFNSKKRFNTSSRFKGVSWNTEHKSWHARCNVDKKKLNIGYYKDEVEAALAYNVTASFAHGEFARLNKI